MKYGSIQFGNMLAAGLLSLVSLAVPHAARAAVPDDPLYQSVVLVTGYDMRSRPYGFQRTLRDVLVKLSGNPGLEKDPRVAELGKYVDLIVTRFDYVDQMAGIKKHDDQGSYDRPYYLTVRFDPVAIDQMLAQLGEKPWRGKRRVIVPIIAMHGRSGPLLVSSDEPAAADERQSFTTIANDYALGSRIPTKTELKAWGVSIDRLPDKPVAGRPGEAVVAGMLNFEDAVGWSGAWHFRWHGTDYSWNFSGVNYDEAFRRAVRGVLRLASGHKSPE